MVVEKASKAQPQKISGALLHSSVRTVLVFTDVPMMSDSEQNTENSMEWNESSYYIFGGDKTYGNTDGLVVLTLM